MFLLYLNVRINCYRSYIGPSGTKEVISGKDRTVSYMFQAVIYWTIYSNVCEYLFMNTTMNQMN